MIYFDLKGYRERNGITQEEVADILGITQPAVSQMEKSMSLKTINRIAEALNVDAMELIKSK